MKKNTSYILMILMFIIPILVLHVSAQDTSVEIIGAPSRVTVDEEFSFSVRIDNAQDYNTISLTSSGTEDLVWGSHVFSTDYVLYTRDYTISLDETGYYQIHVTVTAMTSGYSPIERSFSVYVEERTTSNNPATALLSIVFNPITLGIGLICIVLVLRKRGKTIVVDSVPEKRTYTEVKVLILCPYCGKKFEQGLTECSNCKANV